MVAKPLVSSGRQPRVLIGAFGRLDRGRFCAVAGDLGLLEAVVTSYPWGWGDGVTI